MTTTVVQHLPQKLVIKAKKNGWRTRATKSMTDHVQDLLEEKDLHGEDLGPEAAHVKNQGGGVVQGRKKPKRSRPDEDPEVQVMSHR